MQTILLIEDTKTTVDLINTTLTENGYLVSIALNGKQGVRIAQKLLPDLILMDILMPEMNGYEACMLLKESELTKDIPVIFMSALSKTFDKVKAFQVGGVDYINKPIETEELLARIRTHLKINSLQTKLLLMNEELEAKVRQRTQELEENNRYLVGTIEELSKKSAALIRSEERFRQITESITDYIYKVHVSGKEVLYTKHSSSCVAVTGYTEEELNASPFLWFETIYPDDRDRYKVFIERFVQFPQNCNIEHRLVTKTGVVKWVSNTILAFVDEKGMLFEYDGIIKDITERKKLEMEVFKSIIDTEEKERVRFAQEIHDGIGPILSAAKMYVQWIAQTSNRDDIPELLEKTNNLIEDAYNTTREISQKLSPHVLQNFGLLTAIQNFVASIKIARQLEVHVDGDTVGRFDIQKETVVYRVVTECLNNTLKHAQATVIHIDMKRMDEHLTIVYSDNGAGFDHQKLKQSGGGLGLFNMKNRIEALGGGYTIQSKEGEGTVITIQLVL